MRRLAFGTVVALLLTGCGSLGDWVPLPPVEVSNSGLGRMDVVDRVVDGDTVDLADGTVRVRVLGIDSPETKHPQKGVECGGPESASWAAEQLVRGAGVRLEFEPGGDVSDRYGRVLAYVMYQRPGSDAWLDFSVESARAGMSRTYVFNKKKVSRHDSIASAEAEARNAARGFWGRC